MVAWTAAITWSGLTATVLIRFFPCVITSYSIHYTKLYDDIVLLRAEALVQKGGTANIAEALTLLNSIRTRAGLPAFDTEADAVAMYGDMESAILHERSIELCYEGHRWFDLVRTGRAIEVMGPINGLSDEKNLVWPISQGALDKNPNLVHVITSYSIHYTKLYDE